MKKSVRITSATRAQLWAEKDIRIATEIAKGSTGGRAKDREIVWRDMLNKRGITWSGDLRARGLNREDIVTSTEDGEQIVVEVKHGGGALAYAVTYNLESFDSRDRELCLRGVDYVLYCKTAEGSDDRHDMADRYIVATREDFLDMLEEYCHGSRRSGWETATKFNNSSRTAIQIQSMYIDEFFTGLESELGNRTMSAYEFCTTVLGREPHWER